MTQNELKSVLNYDKETGNFYWKVSKGRAKIGEIAGKDDLNGYKMIGINYKYYLAHRLAWLYEYGEFPENNLDHINCNKLDNRIVNLREASKSQNSWNKTLFKNNTSGIKGVYWEAKRKLWRVTLGYFSKRIFLGRFKDKEMAELVAIEAMQKYHKEFANHGS
jgi:hypothetical protein